MLSAPESCDMPVNVLDCFAFLSSRRIYHVDITLPVLCSSVYCIASNVSFLLKKNWELVDKKQNSITKIAFWKDWYHTPGQVEEKARGLGGFYMICSHSSAPRSEVNSEREGTKVHGLLS